MRIHIADMQIPGPMFRVYRGDIHVTYYHAKNITVSGLAFEISVGDVFLANVQLAGVHIFGMVLVWVHIGNMVVADLHISNSTLHNGMILDVTTGNLDASSIQI